MTETVSVVVPAFNESTSIGPLVSGLRLAGRWLEIIVVDDGSSDGTADMQAENFSVPVRYLVANPSSYLYLETWRPVKENPAARCPGLDKYKYGLDQLTGYAGQTGAEAIRLSYPLPLLLSGSLLCLLLCLHLRDS